MSARGGPFPFRRSAGRPPLRQTRPLPAEVGRKEASKQGWKEGRKGVEGFPQPDRPSRSISKSDFIPSKRPFLPLSVPPPHGLSFCGGPISSFVSAAAAFVLITERGRASSGQVAVAPPCWRAGPPAPPWPPWARVLISRPPPRPTSSAPPPSLADLNGGGRGELGQLREVR